MTHHHHHKGGSSVAANSSNASANATSVTSPTAGEENQEKPQERLTSFRRGTTVWYLSRAAGAPCPFASAGIALRDYSECSGITGAESRRGATSSNPASGSGSANWTDDEGEGETGGPCRGLKRKRAGLRTRNVSGAVVGTRTKSSDSSVVDEDVREGRKPPKVKLTLKLRPPQSCLSIVSKPVVTEELSDLSDSSSEDSDSDEDSDGSMDVDVVRESTPIEATSEQSPQSPVEEQPQPFAFPPFPLQRRISIPPYTPAEEDFPVASSSYRGWTAATPSFNTNFTWTEREPSVPLSVASPPPDSDDDDFDMNNEEVEEASPELNFVKKEEEIPFKFEWPLAASTSSSSSSSSTDADMPVKTEDNFDFNFFGTELDDLGLGSLNLGFDNIKVEDDSDDLTATYMRALTSVMPSSHPDFNDDVESIFDVDSVVHRTTSDHAVCPSVSGWQDDYGTGMF